MADTFDLDRLVEATVAGAPELSPAQVDHFRSILAPHLDQLATPAPVVALTATPDGDALRRAAA